MSFHIQFKMISQQIAERVLAKDKHVLLFFIVMFYKTHRFRHAYRNNSMDAIHRQASPNPKKMTQIDNHGAIYFWSIIIECLFNHVGDPWISMNSVTIASLSVIVCCEFVYTIIFCRELSASSHARVQQGFIVHADALKPINKTTI